jgi:poly-gamma-glutamate synthesis protein (capsule biosynthesis protein)
LLRAKGIQAIGAGRNLAEARQPAIIECKGLRVAMLAYCSVLHEGLNQIGRAGDQRQ